MDGVLLLHVETAVQHDSNVFVNANEESDWILRLSPHLQFLRRAGTIQLDASAGVDVLRFLDLSDENTENFFTRLSLTYPNRPGFVPTYGRFDIGWRERSFADQSLGELTHSQIFDVGANVRHFFSDKLALTGAAGYSQENFDLGRFSKIERWKAGGNIGHFYSDKLELFTGYRYRRTETEGRTQRSLGIDDHLLHVGGEGALFPRVVGRVSVGVQHRRFNDNAAMDNETRPYGDLSLDWSPKHRTVLTLAGGQDFDVTADDRSVDMTRVSLTLNQGISQDLSFKPNINYSHQRYTWSGGSSRTDDSYGAGIGLVYDLNMDASLGVRYSYLDRDSSDAFHEWARHIWEVSGKITF